MGPPATEAGGRRAVAGENEGASMKRFLTACAVAVVTVFGLAACNDYGNTFQSPTGASVTGLSPSTISAGSPAFTLTVTGGGFVKQTVVQWNEQTIPTTVALDGSGNVTGVTATVAASLVAKPGTAFVQTLNPHSGSGTNGLSNPIAFIINPPPNPVPTISQLSPNIAAAGSGSLPLTITGTNFILTSDPSGGSSVNWNVGPTQTVLPSPTVSATSIQVTVPASLLAVAGCPVVTVQNPPSTQTTPTGGVPNPAGGGGGASNGLRFTVGASGSCASITAAKATAASMTVLEETPALSSDGRYVAYAATQNEHAQVFVRDTCEGAPSGCQQQTQLLSVSAEGAAGNNESRSPSMSADGRYVAFSSAATNLVSGSPTGHQIYLRDTCAGAQASSCTPSTQLVSSDANGALVGTESILPSVSASGRFVAFVAVTPSNAAANSMAQTKPASSATNSGYRQIFIRDTCVGATSCTPKTTRISMQPGDASSSAPDAKPAGPALSGKADHVAAPGAQSATVFTRRIPVDDSVFLALTNNQP
jgi:WD40-like Beta Propeller Repeat